MTLATSKCFRN